MNTNEETPNTESTPAVQKKTKKSTGKRGKKMATATKKSKKSKANDNPMAILSERRSKYGVDKKNLTAGGNPTVSIGDGVAKALAGQDVASLKKIAKENGVAERFSGWEKAGLNPGQLRMNLGNVLRGIVRRGEQKVTVNGKQVK